LRILNLGHNQITDVRPLAKLTSLETIFLTENPIIDIEPLKKLPNLKELYVDYTKIPQRSLREFKESRERAWEQGKAPYFIIVGIN
jgi:succinate dehydrogenase/fumarate reductase-like Fe-S protein